MAKQDSIIKLTGRVGEFSFFKNRAGEYQARRAGGVSAERILSEPQFARVRENMTNFQRASSAGKLLRTALAGILANYADGKMSTRLASRMSKVIKMDLTSQRGQQNVIDGEASLLLGFDFNVNARLDQVILTEISTVVDRELGTCTVKLPSYNPSIQVNKPDGATHYRFETMAALVDFETGTYLNSKQNSDFLVVDTIQPTEPLELVLNLDMSSTRPVFVVVGIDFSQQFNGEHYMLHNSAFKACRMMCVNTPV